MDCVGNRPVPKDKKDIQRMLGVFTYFSKYLPRFSHRTTLLRNLLKTESVFKWTLNHDNEWKTLKTSLTTVPVLAFYNEALETKVSMDASSYGLGAALFQRHDTEWRPVAYESRVLTECESRYSQIEKEARGSAFGCERFHNFIYGRPITLETDHQPLIAIAKKNVGDMPPRLQRFFLRLMKYDYKFQFVPGKQLVLADALSRAPAP